jgi:acyl-CoA synthetase (AMP-forming)/AMP-acid ligase II
MVVETNLISSGIAQLLDQQCDRFLEKEAVLSKWQGIRLTYKALHSTAREIATNLLRQGVRPGDRAVVLAGNTIEYVQLFFAVSAIGGVFTIINPTFTVDEILPAMEFVGKIATPLSGLSVCWQTLI